MREVNRSVLIPKPRGPYLAWVQSLGGDGSTVTLAQLRDDCEALLIPEIEDLDDLEAFLRDHHVALFEYLLASWIDDPAAWPACRDLATLREWFDLELSTLAYDVCDWELRHTDAEDVEPLN